ncbi:MAG: ATP-binding protein [Spirochaetes bacterium]|nr:ATP-binding protein [Spirochaetota bacterium]
MNLKLPRSPALAVLVLLAAVLPLQASGDPLYINLNEFPLYIRTGFEPGAENRMPTGVPDWKIFPATGNAGRYARPIELGLAGVAKRPFFSLANYPEMEFTYAIPFTIGAEMAAFLKRGREGSTEAPLVPGIHFAALGDDWEIFLNGTKIRSEIHLDANGRIAKHRTSGTSISRSTGRSSARAPTSSSSASWPTRPSPPAGLHQAEPYFVGTYELIQRRNAELWPVALIGLYLFIGLYHIFIFFVRPQDRHNLFYGLFSIDLAIYLFARTHTVYFFVPDSDLLFHIELGSLFLILPFVGAFLENLNDNRAASVSKVYAVLCAFLAIAQALTPDAFAHDLLRVWQVSGLLMALYYLGYDILGRFFRDGYRRWKRPVMDGRRPSLGRIYLRSLAGTPIGNLLIGGLILANRLGFLHGQLKGLNQNLEERIRTLTETSGKLAASEHRYRSLFEGTSDPVALLDGNLGFIEGNNAARDFFGLDRPGREGCILTDAVYTEEREGDLPVRRLRQAFDAQERRAEIGEISTRLRTQLGEPRPCRLREVIVNAIEHGNLEIGFGEKTESQQKQRYFEFLQQRRLEPAYRDRRVFVEYSVSAARATYRVTDEGKGFDHHGFLLESGEPDPGMLEHGRGLFMAMNAFDRVVFNDKGNQVTLVKYFAGAT